MCGEGHAILVCEGHVAREERLRNSRSTRARQCRLRTELRKPTLDRRRYPGGMVRFFLADVSGRGKRADLSRAVIKAASVPQWIDQLRQLPQVWWTGGTQMPDLPRRNRFAA